MTKGYLWIAQNNSTTDYVECSVNLCKSIKKYCSINKVAIITDSKTKIPQNIFDEVIVLDKDLSENIEWKMNNEYRVFDLSPFTHTIKLEADMLFTHSTDWWWNHLHQHELVFSQHCRDYQDNVISYGPYRKLFVRNYLNDVYNGLHYFRRSKWAHRFYQYCEIIIKNWDMIKNEFLIDCHDPHPTTDVVYALAYKILDPTNSFFISYDWFNFIHGKIGIHQSIRNTDNLYNFLNPLVHNDGIYLGGYKLNRLFHYFEKDFLKEAHGRVF